MDNKIIIDSNITNNRGSVIFYNPIGIIVRVIPKALMVIQVNNVIFCIQNLITFSYSYTIDDKIKFTIIEKETEIILTEYVTGEIHKQQKIPYENEGLFRLNKLIAVNNCVEFIKSFVATTEFYEDALKSIQLVTQAKLNNNFFEIHV